jgi:acyl-CoA synthetase (NDP forming)
MPVEAPPANVASSVLDRAAAEGRSVLLEPEVYALLAAAGIGVPAHRQVAHPDEVSPELCAALPSDRVVVKLVSPDILHKSDVGGVLFCSNDTGAIRRAVRQVLESGRRAHPGASICGALVAEVVEFQGGFGREVLAGFRHDPTFGPVVVMGVGGLDTEYLLTSLLPERAKVVAEAHGLSEEKALFLLRGTVVHEALTGRLRSTRGAGISEDRLVLLLLGLAGLAERYASFRPGDGLGLVELEVNPFVATFDGRLLALDGLARLHRPAPLSPSRPIANLRHLLTPSSAVVIGASAEGNNVGRVILRNLIQGGCPPRDRIWAIHPRAQAIDGCRAFASLDALPEVADMAVVAVAADKGGDQVVVDLVTKRRARTVTLISGGFGETQAGRGAEGRMRQAIEDGHRAPDGGVLVNGGNCLGIISVPGGYNTFFIPPYKLPFHDAPGHNVASISQSGAYLVTQISNLDRAVRPRYAISFGNQLDVTASDYLDFLAGDAEVRVFAVYLEGFRRGDGVRFLEVARRIVAEGRTVLLYKAGRTPEGGAAAASHTAAAVGDYEVCRELARSAGVIDCFTLNMFEDYLMTFSFLADRKTAGHRVAVLSNAGFECTAAADKLYGLELATFSPQTRERLQRLLPTGIVDVHNPVDATPVTPTENYVGCVEALLDDPGIDALVVAGVPATPYLEDLARGEGHGEDISRETSLPSRLIRIFRATQKPIVFSIDSGSLYEGCVQMMKRAGLPCFRKVDRATRALAALVGVGWGVLPSHPPGPPAAPQRGQC